MKTIKVILIVFAFLNADQIMSQRDRRYNERAKTETPKVLDKVDNTNNTIEESNETLKNTKSAVRSTIDDTKETLNDIKNIFKSKKNKSVKSVLVTINNISYGNAKLKALQKALLKAKGVKYTSKNYKNNIATIEVIYKKNADNLWESIPENISNAFDVISINDNQILVNLRE